MGEPAATKCLAYLLQREPSLHAATIAWLSAATDCDLSQVRDFHEERVHDGGGRPDIVGTDVLDRPVLVVEAKFGAELSEGQVAGYLVDQRSRLGDASGAMVVLVPEARFDSSRLIVERAKATVGLEDFRTAVVGWDEWLRVWEQATSSAEGENETTQSDLVQLRGLLKAMGGLVGTRYAPDDTASWRAWQEELSVLVREFTLEVIEHQGHKAQGLPVQTREAGFSPARYVSVPRAGLPTIYLLVGLAHQRADNGYTPIWARLSRDYSKPILGRVLARFPGADDDEVGQVWIPLTVPPALVGRERVHDMADQLRQIIAALAELP